MSVATAQPLPQQFVAVDVLSGKRATVQLSSQKKALVVIFMSANCPSSTAHVGTVKQLQTTYKQFEFVVLHSNQDETLALAKNYFATLNLQMPILQDEGAVYADKLKAAKTPHVSVLGSRGEILYQGGITNSNDPARADQFFLRDALENIEKSQPVKVPLGRTLGCLIHRGEKNVW
jgi:Redoxin.